VTELRRLLNEIEDHRLGDYYMRKLLAAIVNVLEPLRPPAGDADAEDAVRQKQRAADAELWLGRTEANVIRVRNQRNAWIRRAEVAESRLAEAEAEIEDLRERNAKLQAAIDAVVEVSRTSVSNITLRQAVWALEPLATKDAADAES